LNDSTPFCECGGGFTGEFCENIVACTNNPCNDAGMCMAMDKINYICICFSGFTGKTCQIKKGNIEKY